MRFILPLALLSATPAFAAPGSFFSLENTDFIVVLGFLVFIAILLYFRIPSMLTGMLDDRSKGIRNDLDEARALRDEAQALLASYERKTRDARDQAEATAAGDQAKIDLQTSVARRMAAAEDQIESAQNAAVREVRDTAITVAIAAAGEVVAKQMSAAEANTLIDQSIDTVAAKLH